MIEGPIRLPHSNTPGATPTTGSLATLSDMTTRAIEEGEILVNQADGRMFMKTAGEIIEVTRRSYQKPTSGTYVAPTPIAANLTTVVLTAGTAFLWAIPFKPAFSFTASALGYNVTTAGAGTADLALFEADPALDYAIKENPVYYTNGLSLGSVGNVDWTLPSPFVFSPTKLYYLAMRTSSDATATVRAITPASAYPNQININSNTQGSFYKWTAAGIGGGGSAEAPGGTSGRWLSISTWSHMALVLGNVPVIAAKI